MNTQNYLRKTTLNGNKNKGYYNLTYNSVEYLIQIHSESVSYHMKTKKEEFRWFVDIIKIDGKFQDIGDASFLRFAKISDGEEMSGYEKLIDAIDFIEKAANKNDLKTIIIE